MHKIHVIVAKLLLFILSFNFSIACIEHTVHVISHYLEDGHYKVHVHNIKTVDTSSHYHFHIEFFQDFLNTSSNSSFELWHLTLCMVTLWFAILNARFILCLPKISIIKVITLLKVFLNISIETPNPPPKGKISFENTSLQKALIL